MSVTSTRFVRQLADPDPEETAEWVDSINDVIESSQGPTRAHYLLRKQLEHAADRGAGFPVTVSTPYVNTIPVEDQPVFPGDAVLERRIRAIVRWNAAIMVTRANMVAEGIGGHLSSYASSASLYEVGFNHFFRGKDDGHGDQVYFQGHAAPGIYARAFLEGRLTEGDLDNFRREVGPGGQKPGPAGPGGQSNGPAGPGAQKGAPAGPGGQSNGPAGPGGHEHGPTDSAAPRPGPAGPEGHKHRGLSSYPHPRLMPEFWEFPTVSMGLGPLNAVYQARFARYLAHRGIADTSDSKIWCFLGDGECDEPEALAGLSLAAREGLDNLIFVVNCNLQRLDGPVRGNGKVIQELEGLFRGAGWNVLKVVWGSEWDGLLAADTDGVLVERMNTTVDGEFQKHAVEGGGHLRERFFGADPRLAAMVAHLSDEQLAGLARGGHDLSKVYAAYHSAVAHQGAPTVILAKTVKGRCLGPAIEARNAAHQMKKMTTAQLLEFRDGLGLSELIPDDAVTGELPNYYRPADGSTEHQYLMARRAELSGPIPRRVVRAGTIASPDPKVFSDLLDGSKDRAVSTTMAFGMLLRALLRDKAMGDRVVPIIPDEARTFGMDALFGEVGIYAPFGQRYEPVDAGMQLSYKESQDGQILEEGITEAGSMASFTAAGTSYATWGEAMVPFYIFYSMFGFQRTGDLMWAFGDARGRGFLLGATAGRTTLNGEGLQHEDGHSLVLASTVPNLVTYDPAFAYEVAVIVREGLARMYGEAPEDVFYYLTLYNENYPMPPMPTGAEEGIVRGLHRFADAPSGPTRKATIVFSGTAQAAAREAAELLAEHHGVAAELWSATSYKSLREDALGAERWNRLHPTEAPRPAYVSEQLARSEGPIVAVSDFMKAVPDQVARWVPRSFTTLGTDGYGRSDTRASLRRHFETDASHIVVAVLKALADEGEAETSEVAKAIAAYGIDADAVEPLLA